MITDTEKAMVLEAVKALKLDDSIELRPDENSIGFSYFNIEKIEETEQVPWIGGVREQIRNIYICTEEIIIGGSYWEPPDSDYIEFAEKGSWLAAVGACAVQDKQHEVDNLLESIVLASIANEDY